ncbi:MAG TPA: GNAT family N-acetyltransferase [Solirubrobacterales bacterium]
MAGDSNEIRIATAEDAAAIALLLDRFNTEFDAETPGVEALRVNAGRLLEAGEMTVLLAGGGSDGLSVLRLRGSVWTGRPEAYLQELYVVPEHRGRGIGRALLEATMATAREAGARAIDLATGEGAAAARALYESAGFTNFEASAGRPRMPFYEREL